MPLRILLNVRPSCSAPGYRGFKRALTSATDGSIYRHRDILLHGRYSASSVKYTLSPCRRRAALYIFSSDCREDFTTMSCPGRDRSLSLNRSSDGKRQRRRGTRVSNATRLVRRPTAGGWNAKATREATSQNHFAESAELLAALWCQSSSRAGALALDALTTSLPDPPVTRCDRCRPEMHEP